MPGRVQFNQATQLECHRAHSSAGWKGLGILMALGIKTCSERQHWQQGPAS